jgi:hypothetical protein
LRAYHDINMTPALVARCAFEFSRNKDGRTAAGGAHVLGCICSMPLHSRCSECAASDESGSPCHVDVMIDFPSQEAGHSSSEFLIEPSSWLDSSFCFQSLGIFMWRSGHRVRCNARLILPGPEAYMYVSVRDFHSVLSGGLARPLLMLGASRALSAHPAPLLLHTLACSRQSSTSLRLAPRLGCLPLSSHVTYTYHLAYRSACSGHLSITCPRSPRAPPGQLRHIPPGEARSNR